MANPIEPGSPDAVHLAYRGDTAGICGRPTGVLTSDPGDYDCPECDAMYVGIMNPQPEAAMHAAGFPICSIWPHGAHGDCPGVSDGTEAGEGGR